MSKILIEKQWLLDRIAELEDIKTTIQSRKYDLACFKCNSFINKIKSILQKGEEYTSPKQEESKETWGEILDEFAKFGKGKLGDWLIENFEIPKRK